MTSAVLALVAYGALALAERRSGRILMLVGALGGLAMPVIHLRTLAGLRPDFFFVWTLLALGVVSLFSLMLAIGALGRPVRSP